MTTSKTAREIEHLIMAELIHTCPECADITNVTIMPADDSHDDGNWTLAAILRDRSAAESARCKRAQVAAVSRLRQEFHLIAE
jgi:hypothetical protein